MSLRISQENGKKDSEGRARFLPGGARRNALFSDSLVQPSALLHKLGESIWWLNSLANRMDIDIKTALKGFFDKAENTLKE